MDISHKIGIALVGAGRIGCVHYRNILNNRRFGLLYVVRTNFYQLAIFLTFDLRKVDVLTEKARELADKSGTHTKGTSDLTEALSDQRVQAVLVANPTNYHVQTILAAVQVISVESLSVCSEYMKAKKHVLCEKPISLSLKEIDECYAEATKNGVRLLCGFQRRHDASFAKLQKAVMDGLIGETQV